MTLSIVGRVGVLAGSSPNRTAETLLFSGIKAALGPDNVVRLKTIEDVDEFITTSKKRLGCLLSVYGGSSDESHTENIHEMFYKGMRSKNILNVLAIAPGVDQQDVDDERFDATETFSLPEDTFDEKLFNQAFLGCLQTVSDVGEVANGRNRSATAVY